MAKIISITNTKGGTGKSTVTVLLASALALEDKKRVLVLDCDNQESIADLRNLELDQDSKAPYDIKSLVPRFVHDYIDLYGNNYDYIFLDLPRITSHEQSDTLYNLVVKCDALFIPILSNHFDAASTIKYLKGIKEIKEFKDSEGVEFNFYGFLSRKERRKSNDTIIRLMERNGLKMMVKSIPKLAFFESVSTLDNPFNTSDGVLRFKPFYKEFKSKLS